MGAPHKYDVDDLRKYVKLGMCQESIMEKMGIENPLVFNSVRVRLMDIDGKYYKIPTRKSLLEKSNPVKVSKSQLLIIGRDILNACAFEPEDEFFVTRTSTGLILTKKGIHV